MFTLIPAIDLKNGKCVRLHQGDYNQETVYSDDPVSIAKIWESMGAQRIHVVDLDGAKSGCPENFDIASRIVNAVKIPCDFGGGIRNEESAISILKAGFFKFSIGTKALDDTMAALFFGKYSNYAIADIAARDGKVSVEGWQKQLTTNAADLGCRLVSMGCQEFIFTDISRDGALIGPNIEAIKSFAQAVNTPVVASGGISSIQDVLNLATLEKIGVTGAITGKALYDGRIDLREAILALNKFAY